MPIPFTFGGMLPLPQFAGRGEWALCKRRQIEESIKRKNDGEYLGACLPRLCSISNPDRHDPECAGDGGRGFDIASRTPWLQHALENIEDADGSKRASINAAFEGGVAARINAFVSFTGWTVSLILATYAIGGLKRKE